MASSPKKRSPRGRRNSGAPAKTIEPDPRAAHTAALEFAGERFILRFWSEKQWSGLTAGEYARMNITRLPGFGAVSVDQVEPHYVWSNVVAEVKARALPFPELEKLPGLIHRFEPEELLALVEDLARHDFKPVRELVAVGRRYGLARAAELLERYLADKAVDQEYWEAARAADDARKQAIERPVGFRVCEEEVETYFEAKPGLTLDDVVGQELEDIARGPFRDRTIWQGEKLLATITHGPSGTGADAVVTYYDTPGGPTFYDEAGKKKRPSRRRKEADS